jgi:hypothetical protein
LDKIPQGRLESCTILKVHFLADTYLTAVPHPFEIFDVELLDLLDDVEACLLLPARSDPAVTTVF